MSDDINARVKKLEDSLKEAQSIIDILNGERSDNAKNKDVRKWIDDASDQFEKRIKILENKTKNLKA